MRRGRTNSRGAAETVHSTSSKLANPPYLNARARSASDAISGIRDDRGRSHSSSSQSVIASLIQGDLQSCVDKGRAYERRALKSGPDGDFGDAQTQRNRASDDPILLRRSEVVMPAHNEAVTSLAYNESSRLLVSGGGDCIVRSWRVRGGLSAVTLQDVSPGSAYRHQRPISSLHVLTGPSGPSGGVVVACDGAVHVWDVERATRLEEVRPSRKSRFTITATAEGMVCGSERDSPSTRVRSRGHYAASTSSGTICIFDLRTQSRRKRWSSYSRTSIVAEYTCSDLSAASKVPQITSLAFGGGFGADASWIAAGTRDGHISVIDLRMGVLVRSWMSTEQKQITSVGALRSAPSLAIDGLVSVCADGTVSAWNAYQCQSPTKKGFDAEVATTVPSLPSSFSPPQNSQSLWLYSPRRMYFTSGMCPGSTPSASMSALRRSVCVRWDARRATMRIYAATATRLAALDIAKGRDSSKAHVFSLRDQATYGRGSSRLKEADIRVHSMALLPRHDAIIFGTADGTIRVWG
eukprot:g3774.t1